MNKPSLRVGFDPYNSALRMENVKANFRFGKFGVVIGVRDRDVTPRSMTPQERDAFQREMNRMSARQIAEAQANLTKTQFQQ